MNQTAALPFHLVRSEDVIGGAEMSTTRETVQGLLLLDGDRLVVQWRLDRATERYGSVIRTDREVEPVRQTVIPLVSIASARVRHGWLGWLLGPALVLTAADLRAFEEVVGVGGLRLAHPARLTVRIRRGDLLAAREFAAELELAAAERAIRRAEGGGSLGDGEQTSETRNRLDP
jgi:hypothetical protein